MFVVCSRILVYIVVKENFIKQITKDTTVVADG